MRTGTERATAYRQRMVANGWRELRLWVPDTRTPQRRASLAAQGRAIAASAAEEADVLAWVGSWDSWDEAE